MALDDYVITSGGESRSPLFALADVIKIEFPAMPPAGAGTPAPQI